MANKLSSYDTDLVGLEPVISANTNVVIQDRLIAFINERRLTPGDRLPPEGQLRAKLGVSRAALREAMRSMEALGIIEARSGSGWYVKRFSLDSLAKGLALKLELTPDALADLNEIRVCLEGNWLRHAMRTLRAEDLQSLQSLAEEMEHLARAGESFAEQDREFHRVLFSRIRNQVFGEIMAVFWKLYVIANSDLMPHGDRVAEACEHRLILEAIRDGDEALARQRLEDSLKGAFRRLPPTTAAP